jgi:hypothetical protein
MREPLFTLSCRITGVPAKIDGLDLGAGQEEKE